MINRHIKLDSKNIAGIGYHPESGQLEVVFTSDAKKSYVYKNVTPLQYAQLMNAKSVGGHFAQTIRKDVKAHPFTVQDFKGKLV